MKKPVAYILLFLVLFTLIAYLPVVKLIQNDIRTEVKHRIKQHINESELTLIRVNDHTPMFWTKKNKEFRLNGKMYDVVKSEIKNNEVLYYCIYDAKESCLFEHLEQYVAQFLGEYPQQQKTVHNILQKLELTYTLTSLIKIPLNSSKGKLMHYNYTDLYHFDFIDLKSPPPKLYTLL